MNFDLKDKVVLITGGARGIGFAIAEAFAADGAIVVLVDLVAEAVQQAVAKLQDKHARAFGYAANVCDGPAMENVMSEVVKNHGALYCLINNAGITRDNLVMRMKEEEWQMVLDVNLKGSFVCTQKAFKHMMKARSGCIINMASVIGLMGNAGQANYAASKGGLIAFTKSCAKEFASRGVRVNAIAPGFIETEMTAVLSEEVKAEYAKVIPLSKMGTPLDVAKVCMFLASPAAEYITGQTIAVDGGLTMH